ncbi:hypothetical protein Q4543_12375 [Salipiger sp. 1_MG-2023]|uniref:DUF6882 domain-containing protein n=1 Tax=Salipiger sp. 1_MG-2023 TaxID=3062665 RepID=UPI0026E14D1D|nr:DUF6882 domain-containing protein [Salipiger sp. 1_MG-2023]MDO6586310.1 hypothetical protein [Salipiger sp. 1_MG-2023]
MTRPEKIRLDISRKPSPSAGSYAGTGIWSYSATSHETRELAQPARLRDMLETVAADFQGSLPDLYRAWALDDPRGQWEVWPDEGLFKVTTVSGRIWYARYGLVSSWNHETHSWLWSWAFPREWETPQGILEPAWALHREAALKGWAPGVEPSLLVNDREAMRLACLAAHVANRPMVYRAKVNEVNTHFFMLEQPVWAN